MKYTEEYLDGQIPLDYLLTRLEFNPYALTLDEDTEEILSFPLPQTERNTKILSRIIKDPPPQNLIEILTHHKNKFRQKITYNKEQEIILAIDS